jgi:flagellar export protein FliJ
MKRFNFRAGKVLDLRRHQHAVTLAELARAQQQRDIAAAALSTSESAVDQAQVEYRACLEQGRGAAIFERHRNWIIGLRAGAESCRRLVAERQIKLERAAADVRHTHRQVLVLENLRERAWQEYQAETKRLDAIEMDQLAVTQYARRM